METWESYIKRTEAVAPIAHDLVNRFIDRSMLDRTCPTGDRDMTVAIALMMDMSRKVSDALPPESRGIPGRNTRAPYSIVHKAHVSILPRLKAILFRYVPEREDIRPILDALPDGATEADFWDHLIAQLVLFSVTGAQIAMALPGNVRAMFAEACNMMDNGTLDTLPEA